MADELDQRDATKITIEASLCQATNTHNVWPAFAQAQPSYSERKDLQPINPQDLSVPRSGDTAPSRAGLQRNPELSAEGFESRLKTLELAIVERVAEHNDTTSARILQRMSRDISRDNISVVSCLNDIIENESLQIKHGLGQVDGKVEELNGITMDLGTLFTSVYNSVTGVSNTITNVDFKVNSMASALDNIRGSLDTQIVNFEREMADLGQDVTGKMADLGIADLKKEVAEMNSNVKGDIVNLTESIHDLSINADLKIVDLKNAVNGLRIDLDRRFEALQTAVNELVTTQTRIMDELARVSVVLRGDDFAFEKASSDSLQSDIDCQITASSTVPLETWTFDGKLARISVDICTLTDVSTEIETKTFDTAFTLDLREMQSLSNLMQLTNSKLSVRFRASISKIIPSNRLQLQEIVTSSEAKGVDRFVNRGGWEVWLNGFALSAQRDIFEVRLVFYAVSTDRQMPGSKKRKAEDGSVFEDDPLFFCTDFEKWR